MSLVLPLLGVLSGVKASLRLLPLVIPYSGTLRYDMTMVLALRDLHKYMLLLLPPFVTPFGVPVSVNCYVSDFNCGSLHK